MLADVRYAIRQARRSPGFFLTAALTLAIGLAANIALFSLIQTLVFKPMPSVRTDERLVWITASLNAGRRPIPLSYPVFRQISDDAATFESAAVFSGVDLQLADESEPVRVHGQIVSAGYWATLGTRLVLGRAFATSNDELGSSPVAILGYHLWQERYQGDAGVLGRTVSVNGVAASIIGVAPDGFNGPDAGESAIDVWVPLSMQPTVVPDFSIRNPDAWWLSAMARLAPEVPLDRARIGVATRIKRMVAPGGKPLSVGATLVRVRGGVAPGDIASIVPISALAVAVTLLILLVCCANVANMLLSRATGRGREIAVRLSLGAARMRVVRQLLTEGVVLGTAASAIGLGLAFALAKALASTLLPSVRTSIAPSTIVFALACAWASTLTCSLFPALRATRMDLARPLNEGGVGFGRRRSRLQRALVIFQVTLSLVLVGTSALFLDGLYRAASVELGFTADSRVLATSAELPAARYDSAGQLRFVETVARGLRALPGVVAVGSATSLPLSERQTTVDTSAGDRRDARPGLLSAYENDVSPDYFAAMGMSFAMGRTFAPTDVSTSQPVAIVTADFARRMWPGVNPVGKRLRLTGSRGAQLAVIGITRPIVTGSQSGTGWPVVYRPLAQAPARTVTFVVRGNGDATAVAQGIRHVVHDVDPTLALFDMESMAQYRHERIRPIAFGSSLLAGIGAVAVLLASVGLFAVVSFSVGQRTREIGVRIALGAPPQRVTSMFVVEGMRLAAIGILIGSLMAMGVARVVASSFAGLAPNAVGPLVAVSAILLIVATVASWAGARRAAEVDPIEALRAH